MKEELVSFKTAKLAKEKGFDWEVLNHYKKEELINHGLLYNFNSKEEQELWNLELISVPTQSLLQRYLREKHDLFIYVIPRKPHSDCTGPVFFQVNLLIKSKENNGVYDDLLFDTKEINTVIESDIIKNKYNSYEVALEIGLLKGLKLIK